jgi:energy-coupling factor transporter ATP-binding protein EcfA2
MTTAELLPLISKALLSGAVSALSRRTVEGLLQWFSEQAEKNGKSLTKENEEQLRDLLEDDSSLWKALVAQLNLTQRNGICIVGPSGSGKTALFNALSGRQVVRPTRSTSQRKRRAARYGLRYTLITDTPGSIYHVNIEQQTYEEIRRGRIAVLILVMSGGYLETVGAPALTRPGSKQVHSSVSGYLSSTRSEELSWLEDAANYIPEVRGKIPYFMVALNKMDLWMDRFEEVSARYTSGPIQEQLDKLAQQWCRSGVTPTYHPISCLYDSFYGCPPSGKMSAEASALSIQLFRAQIRLRLLER